MKSHLHFIKRGADSGQEAAPPLWLHTDGDDRLRGGAAGGGFGFGGTQDRRAHPGTGWRGA